MNITILGGSGRTGQCVIKQALAQGNKITTLVRSPEKLQEFVHQITIIQGSATNPDDVAKAIQYADVVIHTVSVPFFHKKPTHLFSQISQAVIHAWPQTKAKQYIVMSSFGTGKGRKLSWPFNRGYELFLGDVADNKEQEESLLEQSNLPRTIVKAVLLNDEVVSDYQVIPFDQFRPTIFKHVSRATVARAILDIAQSNLHVHQKIVIMNRS